MNLSLIHIFAVALAKDARALLLDEPTSGLDPSAAAEFTRLLQRASERGVAILATTHDPVSYTHLDVYKRQQ